MTMIRNANGTYRMSLLKALGIMSAWTVVAYAFIR